MSKPDPKISIRLRDPQDDPAIAAMITAAFTSEFGKSGEAALVDALCRDSDVVCELVAVDSTGAIAGHILFSRLEVRSGGQSLKAVALAPLAVRPGLQHQGIGDALARAGLARCRDAGADLAVVLGHPAYYARFGFSALLAKLLNAPYAGPSFMALELRPGATLGTVWQVAYPRAFSNP